MTQTKEADRNGKKRQREREKIENYKLHVESFCLLNKTYTNIKLFFLNTVSEGYKTSSLCGQGVGIWQEENSQFMFCKLVSDISPIRQK